MLPWNQAQQILVNKEEYEDISNCGHAAFQMMCQVSVWYQSVWYTGITHAEYHAFKSWKSTVDIPSGRLSSTWRLWQEESKTSIAPTTVQLSDTHYDKSKHNFVSSDKSPLPLLLTVTLVTNGKLLLGLHPHICSPWIWAAWSEHLQHSKDSEHMYSLKQMTHIVPSFSQTLADTARPHCFYSSVFVFLSFLYIQLFSHTAARMTIKSCILNIIQV